MPLSTKIPEILRLIAAFESEARQFHDVRLGLFYVTQQGNYPDRKFVSPNHTIMLWQHYGVLDPSGGVDRFVENLQHSDMTWGVRGAELSCYAVIEDPLQQVGSRSGAGLAFSRGRMWRQRLGIPALPDNQRAGG